MSSHYAVWFADKAKPNGYTVTLSWTPGERDYTLTVRYGQEHSETIRSSMQGPFHIDPGPTQMRAALMDGLLKGGRDADVLWIIAALDDARGGIEWTAPVDMSSRDRATFGAGTR